MQKNLQKRKRRKQSIPFLWQARVIAHSPSFRLLAHRDSRALARSRFAAEDQAWVDAMSWWNSEEARELEKNEPPTPWWRVPE